MKNKLVAAVVGIFVLGFGGFAHADFVGNKDSKIFHNEACPMVKMMKADNKVAFKTADEAVKIGYTACKKCALKDKAAAKAMFVGNKGSMMYHKATCSMVVKIKEDNVEGFATEEEAEKAGYKACSKCFPSEKKEEKKEEKVEKTEKKAEKKSAKKSDKKTKKDDKKS